MKDKIENNSWVNVYFTVVCLLAVGFGLIRISVFDSPTGSVCLG